MCCRLELAAAAEDAKLEPADAFRLKVPAGWTRVDNKDQGGFARTISFDALGDDPKRADSLGLAGTTFGRK